MPSSARSSGNAAYGSVMHPSWNWVGVPLAALRAAGVAASIFNASRRVILWELLDLDIAVVHFPPFRLQADVSLCRLRVIAFVDEFTVETDGHLTVLTRDLIPVPVAEQWAIPHNHAALRSFDGGPLNAKQAARLPEVALDFEAFRPSLYCLVRMDEEAGIRPAFVVAPGNPAFLSEPPLCTEDVVAVCLFATQ